MPFRSLDVGVVLDVMIHDIDIVLKLADSPVRRVDAVGVSVIGGGVEDVCNARVQFENGCVANFTASRLSLKTERKLRLAGDDGYLSIDFQKKTAALIRRQGNVEAVRDAVAKVRSGQISDLTKLNYAEMVKVEQLEVDTTEPLRAQADAFIDAVTRRTRPIVSAEDGLAAVELAERVVACIAQSMRI
jgi:predicted dehydrogenase